MTKSWRKQQAEAAAKNSQATAAESAKAKKAAAAVEAAKVAAETAQAKAKADSLAAAAAARKALGPTPKATKVKKARHVRPPKRTPAVKVSSTPTAPQTAAGRILAHSIQKTLAKPGAKPLPKQGPGPA